MDKQLWMFIAMSFPIRFMQLRKEHGLTQPQMAEKVGVHITQVKRYESGQAQPSIDVLKKIAVAFNVSTDWLIFDDNERALSDQLQMKFEAVSQMSKEDQKAIQSLIDGMILKDQAKKLTQLG